MILTADELFLIGSRLEQALEGAHTLPASTQAVLKDAKRLLTMAESLPREPKDHPKMRRAVRRRDEALAEARVAEAERDLERARADRLELDYLFAKQTLDTLVDRFAGPLGDDGGGCDGPRALAIVRDALETLRGDSSEGPSVCLATFRVLVQKDAGAPPGSAAAREPWRASIFGPRTEHCAHGASPDEAVARLVAEFDARCVATQKGRAS